MIVALSIFYRSMKVDHIHRAFVIRRGSSNTADRDTELKAAVFGSRLVMYHDEWNNKRTMEARAYGVTPGDGRVIIGFQIDADRGVEPEQLWKSIDDLDRVWVLDDVFPHLKRIVPAQHTAQVRKFEALSVDTEIDASTPSADGY
ncbi:hypothetical protein ACFFYR_08785 [Paraburkholderia dipogonis]